jgi:hypothetical protein
MMQLPLRRGGSSVGEREARWDLWVTMIDSRDVKDETEGSRRRMPIWVSIGIVVVTIAWVCVGAFLVRDAADTHGIGCGGVLLGWLCAFAIQAGLLASPFVMRARRTFRLVNFLMLVPGLALLIAMTIDHIGQPDRLRPSAILIIGSLIVWSAAGYNLLRRVRVAHDV